MTPRRFEVGQVWQSPRDRRRYVVEEVRPDGIGVLFGGPFEASFTLDEGLEAGWRMVLDAEVVIDFTKLRPEAFDV